MHLEVLGSHQKMLPYLTRLGVDGGGLKILDAKTHLHFVLIRDLHVGAANILKQDALSIGADLAVPKGTVIATTKYVDALLIANSRQVEQLSRKELAQPFGLKEVAKELGRIRKSKTPQTVQIMGVINANDDSFYAHSRFTGKQAIDAVHKMIEEGAEIIDVGGVSSRPGSKPVHLDEELKRVAPLVDALYQNGVQEHVTLSIDSYTPEVIHYALDHGFSIVNDITGFGDPDVRALTAQYDATAVIMHMQGTPQTMQAHPRYEHLMTDISNFFSKRIELARESGISNIVLDVGIGFGKRLPDNVQLLAHLEHFLTLGYPLLVGASRKSMIDQIVTTPVEERLPGTLALHLAAVQNGAAILRVHDVKEHVQALKVWQALKMPSV